MIKVAIMGATAHTGFEMIRLLLKHPEAEIIHLGGRREEKPYAAEIFPALEGMIDMRICGMEPDDMPTPADLVFTTLSPTIPMTYAPKYLDAGMKVIDFSADYRFRDAQLYEKTYKTAHADKEHLEEAVYGLPELFHDEIRKARIVGNPGCYPTAAVLSLAPLLAEGLIDPDDIIVDAKSGVSGRGNKLDAGSLYCACNENFYAYAVGQHRHEPEIEHVLARASGRKARVFFTPHLAPMDRGILSAAYVRLARKASTEELTEALKKHYAGKPFVRVRTGNNLPATKDVAFTNLCDVAVRALKDGRAVAISAIDNLAKGAATQAVQNMNIMFSLPEDMGLT